MVPNPQDPTDGTQLTAPCRSYSGQARATLLKYEFTSEPRAPAKASKGKAAAAKHAPTPKFDVAITTYEMLTANPCEVKSSQVKSSHDHHLRDAHGQPVRRLTWLDLA